MNRTLRNATITLTLLGGAILATPALAADLDEGDFGGSYGYIGPGAASLPPPGPYVEAPIYAEPIYPPAAYGPPVYEEPPAVIVAPSAAYEYYGPAAPETVVVPDAAITVGID